MQDISRNLGNVKQLDIKHSQLPPHVLCTLMRGLQTNSTLTVLDISRNGINDEGLLAMVEGMSGKVPQQLRRVNLDSNNITTGGLAVFGRAFENTDAEDAVLFDLRSNPVDAGGSQVSAQVAVPAAFHSRVRVRVLLAERAAGP